MSIELFLFSAAVGAAITEYVFSAESRTGNKQERELLAKARGYCDTGDYRRALSVLEPLMEGDPQNAVYCVLAIPCYGKLARVENLRRNVEKCVSLCEHVQALVRDGASVPQDLVNVIGDILRSHKPVLAQMHERAKSIGTIGGSKTKALDYAERKFVLWLANPEMPELELKASRLKESKKYGEALKWYDKLIRMDSEDGEFHYSRGLCRMMSGDLKGAKEDFDDVLAGQWCPDEVRKGLKQILSTWRDAPANPFSDDPAREASEDFTAGKYDSAIRRLDKLVKLYPERPDYLLLRASCKMGLGSRREAIADLKEILKHKLPDDMRKEIETQVTELSS